MIDALAKRLEKEGKLAAQKVGIVQIEALLKEAKSRNPQLELEL